MKSFYFSRLRWQWGLGFFVVLLTLFPGFCGSSMAEEVIPPKVLTSFEHFTKAWMSRLEQVNQQNSRELKPEAAANGRLVGRFICYGPECVREVRGTDSKTTPYVGIIRYAQRVMEKEGESLQKIKEHPGAPSSEIQVTEIFRYTGGRWIY